MNWTVCRANSDEAIARCFPVLRELRPHLKAETFVPQVRRQQAEHGYRLVYVEWDGQVRSAAGYRILECLAWGRFLYVDDLVTRAEDQGAGFGSVLFDELLQIARHEGCQQFHLDSGVQRFGAHRFYLHKRMDISAHHFEMRLE